MKRLILLLLFPIVLIAQGVNFENFSQGTPGSAPTPTDMGNALYGTLGTCCFSGQTPFTAIQNSNSTLTYTNTSACSDGGPPASINGVTTHSGLILDYSTTQGSGHNNQIIFLRSPNEVGSTTMGFFWFCTDIPVTDSFGTTNDFLQVIGGTSRLANFNSNGSSQNFGLEGCTGPCQGTIPRGTVGTTLLVKWQHVSNSTGCTSVDPTHCMRLAIYDRNLNLIGEEDGTVTTGGTANYVTFGNGNSATMSPGHHMQFSDAWTCWIGCTADMWASMMPNNPELGLITFRRYTDWKQAGIPGNNSGTLPSSAWTQFSTTLTSGSYAGATITANMVGCNNQYYQLGAGTFTVTGNINVPSHCELRGLGANTTFIIAASAAATCRSFTAMVCIKTTGDGTFIGNTPAVDCNWTAGYAQGATQITLSSCTGAGITSIVPGTILALNQCATGFTGANNCTGTATDNGGLYMCLDKYTVTPTGCSANGGGTYERPTIEMPVVTAINTGTGVATISPPLTLPNYSSGQTPQAQIIQPVTMAGVKDLSIDLSAASVDAVCVQLFDGYRFGFAA